MSSLKTYLLKVVGTLVLAIVILLVLQKSIVFFLKQNMNIKLAYLAEDDEQYETLVLGPCEALWAVNPSYFDEAAHTKSYNLSLTHSDFEDNLLHLHLYLKQKTAPKYLLYYVTPESMDVYWNTFNTYRFSNFLDDDFVREIVSEKDPDYSRWNKIPMMPLAYYNNFTSFNALQGAKHYFQNRKTAYHPNGYNPPIFGPQHSVASDMARSKKETAQFTWSTEREKGLERLIEYAQSKGIEVILFESPIFQEVRLVQEDRAEMIAKLETLAIANDVPFYSFADSPVSNSIDNFASHAGLNKDGARLYSKELGEWFNEVIKEQTPLRNKSR